MPSKKPIKRCQWAAKGNKLYLDYHDKEWGVPVYDDQGHFEFLVLESAQAGLSWSTVLNKREGYRKAFANFDANKVARFTTKRIDRLISNPQIIRNRAKIVATVNNAKYFLEVQDEFGSFNEYAWAFVGGKPILNRWSSMAEVPVTSDESDAMSKDMRKRGFRFFGSTICYAHMQAVGMVNDHTTDCFRYKECKKL